MSDNKKYRKLPGRNRGSFSQETLWEGPDHLLSAKATIFREEYRRFYYKDIQYIMIRKTGRGKIINVVFGLLLLLTVLPAALFLEEWPEPLVMAWPFSALFLSMLAINAILGGTCEAHLKTAVQIQRLPSLKRIRSARKAMKRLAPLIEKTQADLKSTVPAPETATGRTVHPSMPASGADVPRPLSDAPRPRGTQAWHVALCLLLLATGMSAVLDFFDPDAVVLMVLFGCLVASAPVCVVALVKQAGKQLPEGLSKIAWTSFAYLCLSFVLTELTHTLLLFQTASVASGNYLDFIRAAAAISPSENGFSTVAHLYFIVGGIALGLAGLIVMAKGGASNRQGVPEAENAP